MTKSEFTCNQLIITNIETKANQLMVSFDAIGNWTKYLTCERTLINRYPKNITEIPKSILLIPFISSFIPLIWLVNVSLIVEEIDYDFYESLSIVKLAYQRMFRNLRFDGNIVARKLIHNKFHSTKSALFFSGGVDSTASLISHVNDKPDLISLIGADIAIDRPEQQNQFIQHVKLVSESLFLNHNIIHSNFRKLLKESRLEFLVRSSGSGWWAGFQFGISVLGQAAPLIYQNGYSRAMIASSFAFYEKQPGLYADDAAIINQIKFNGSQIALDGLNLDRQKKTNLIVEFNQKINNSLPIRVCFLRTEKLNCGQCNKCRLTMLSLLVNQVDPQTLGFEYNQKSKDELIQFVNDIHTRSWASPLWRSVFDQYNATQPENKMLDGFPKFIDYKIVSANFRKMQKRRVNIIVRKELKHIFSKSIVILRRKSFN